MATEVVLLIRTALGPVLERVAASEQANHDLHARVAELVGMRDRLVAVETKAAVTPPEPAPVDLAPVSERLAAAEARLAVLGDLRDRVLTVETKAATPAPVLESAPPVDLGPVHGRLSALELRLEMKSAETAPIFGAIADLTKDVGSIRERVAVVEVRPQIQGPPGEPGKDGERGKDGTAGLTYVGVYQEGKSYDVGDVTTWAGSTWHCNEPTETKPGDGSKAWTLMVKRGRDGRDGVGK